MRNQSVVPAKPLLVESTCWVPTSLCPEQAPLYPADQAQRKQCVHCKAVHSGLNESDLQVADNTQC